MTFQPEDVTRQPGEAWAKYQGRMLDLLGPGEKRAALRRRAKWKAMYRIWVDRVTQSDSDWVPPAHSDTWRKWRQLKRFTPEANAVIKEWNKANLEPAVKPARRVVRPKPKRRVRRVVRPKRKRVVRAKPRAIEEAQYATWLGTMRAKHGASWVPPTCSDTWRKWRNRRREIMFSRNYSTPSGRVW